LRALSCSPARGDYHTALSCFRPTPPSRVTGRRRYTFKSWYRGSEFECLSKM